MSKRSSWPGDCSFGALFLLLLAADGTSAAAGDLPVALDDALAGVLDVGEDAAVCLAVGLVRLFMLNSSHTLILRFLSLRSALLPMSSSGG